MRKIEVVTYDATWKSAYSQEKRKILNVLNNEVVDIFHIGSTSVPNLSAKPIIDILLVVKNINDIDDYNHKMYELGYVAQGENGIKNRRFFVKGGDQRTHHVHVFPKNERFEIKRHIAVRDYLVQHVKIAADYGSLKRKLATEYTYDSEGYCQSKDNYMKHLEHMALQWYNEKHQ